MVERTQIIHSIKFEGSKPHELQVGLGTGLESDRVKGQFFCVVFRKAIQMDLYVSVNHSVPN